jgi:hypothetical protein
MNSDLVTLEATSFDVLPSEPLGPVQELERALRLVAPSLVDHKGISKAVTMIMAKRYVHLVRTGGFNG